MNYKFNFKKEKVIIFILVALLVLSLSYVAFDFAKKIRNGLIYQGYRQAVAEIIIQAENENCEPFSVFYEETEVYLVNTKCLEENTTEEEVEPTE